MLTKNLMGKIYKNLSRDTLTSLDNGLIQRPKAIIIQNDKLACKTLNCPLSNKTAIFPDSNMISDLERRTWRWGNVFYNFPVTSIYEEEISLSEGKGGKNDVRSVCDYFPDTYIKLCLSTI